MSKSFMQRRFLLVIAHPDDEALGCGGTVYKISQAGGQVEMCILSAEAQARQFRPEDAELQADLQASSRMPGISKTYEGSFPNIELNNVSHLQLVQFIEKAIVASRPQVIITHHPSDSNNDHLHCALACQAAMRLFQRKPEVPPCQELWFMEVPSATDWSLNAATNRFQPNLFVEIENVGLEKKLAALAGYRGVMRDYPHPRSQETIRGLAAYRGSQAGCKFAEAYECVFRRIV